MKKLILKAVNKEAVTSKETLQQGRLAVVNSQAGTKYQVIDEATGLPAKGQVIKKKGKDLIVSVDGEEVSVIHDFYADAPAGEAPTYQVSEASGAAGEGASASGGSATGGDSGVVTGGSSSGVSDGIVWNSGTDGSFQVASAADALGADEGLTTTQMVGLGLGGLAAGGGAAAGLAAGGGAAAAAATGGDAVVTVVAGMVAAGPVVTGSDLKVAIYNASGVKIGEGDISEDGSFSVGVGSYTGVVIVKVYDADDSVPDYIDENSREATDLAAPLSAVGYLASAGGTLVINVTPVTTLAAKKLGVDVSGDTPTGGETLNEDGVAATNSAIAKALGLNVDDLLTASIQTVVDKNGDNATTSNAYGVILAALAGDSSTVGSNVFDVLLSSPSAYIVMEGEQWVLTKAGIDLLVNGAASSDDDNFSQGLSNAILELFTKADVTVSINAFDGDNFVSKVELSNSAFSVTGNANPGSEVLLAVDGGSGVTVTADSHGDWAYDWPINTLSEGSHVVSATVGGVTAERVMYFDATDPTVTDVSITGSTDGVDKDGTTYLNGGDTVSVTVTMSEKVDVTIGEGGHLQLNIKIGDTTVQANYASGSGTNQLTFTYAIPVGQNGVVTVPDNAFTWVGAQIKDLAGNNLMGPSFTGITSSTYEVDTSAPVAPPATLTNDTGSDGSDRITSNGEVSVTVAEGATWEYSTDRGTTWVAGTGTAFMLGAGSYAANAVQVRQTDVAGNVSEPTSMGEITVDNVAPAASIAAGQKLNATDTLQVQSSEVGTAYLVYSGLTVTDKASLDAILAGNNDAKWNSVALSAIPEGGSLYQAGLSLAGLTDGTYKLYTVDRAGNLSAVADNTVLVDSNPPTVEGVSITGSTDGVDKDGTTYLNGGDTVSVTVTMSEKVDVTIEEGGHLQLNIKIGDTTVQANYASGSGTNQLTFTYTIPVGQNGVVTVPDNAFTWVGAQIKDLAGNNLMDLSFTGITSSTYEVDTSAPVAPPATLTNDTGSDGSDRITSNGEVGVTVAAGATWEYSTDGGTTWTTGVSTTVGGVTTNTFTLDPGAYAAGAVQVRQTDVAGNVSEPTSMGEITVDGTSSQVENEEAGNLVYVQGQYVPDGNGGLTNATSVTNLDVRSSIVLDFDEAIRVAQGGAVTLSLSPLDGGSSLAATFGADGIYNGETKIGTYRVDSDKLTIDWDADFDLGAKYTLQIGKDAVTDLAGNSLGLADLSVQFSTVGASQLESDVDFKTGGPKLPSSGDMEGGTVAPEWFEITNYGKTYTLGENKSYVIVFKDSSKEDRTGFVDTNVQLIGSVQEAIHIVGFGADDRIYFDTTDDGYNHMTTAAEILDVTAGFTSTEDGLNAKITLGQTTGTTANNEVWTCAGMKIIFDRVDYTTLSESNIILG